MDLQAAYDDVRQASVDMCTLLEIEDYIPQAAFFASPPKWNLAHTSWFWETMILKPFLPDYREYHPDYGFLFNSYYIAAGPRFRRHQRGDISRPTVKEVYAYRRYVNDHMHTLLEQSSLSEEIQKLIILGINHEQQHQELFFTDLKYTFSMNPLFPAYSDKAFCETPVRGNGWVQMSAGLYEIGYRDDGFCFDNELAPHQVYLHDYEISKNLVTNGEFLEFLNDGGYEKHALWHDEGWTWRNQNQIEHPMYWLLKQDGWYQYTLAGLRPLQPEDALTHVSYYEAAAFALWKGLRLPTEFEWEAAADQLKWGSRWEWTESAYLPYPGFKAPAGAVGEYNGKFMVNQKVLRGASVATSPGHSRKTYRNFFHPNLGWQFNGIRLAK